MKITILSSIPYPTTGGCSGIDWKDGFLWANEGSRILKIDPNTGALVQAYTPPTMGQYGLGWDGNLWWTTTATKVRRLNPDFTLRDEFNNQSGGNGILGSDQDYTYDAVNDAVWTGYRVFSDRIYMLDKTTGSVVRQARMDGPAAIAWCPPGENDGNVFCNDMFGQSLHKFDSSGSILDRATIPGYAGFGDIKIAFDRDNRQQDILYCVVLENNGTMIQHINKCLVEHIPSATTEWRGKISTPLPKRKHRVNVVSKQDASTLDPVSGTVTQTLTTWDLENYSFVNGQLFSLSGQMGIGTPCEAFFKPDGLKVYVITQGSIIYQYSLSTAWDIRTTSYDGVSFSVLSQESTSGSGFSGGLGLAFKPDGTKLYITGPGAGQDKVFQYSLSTPWNLTTASYDSIAYDFSADESGATSVRFKPDGTKMYILGDQNNKIYQYTMSTPWDLTTASLSFSVSVGYGITSPYSFDFKVDGSQMYILSNSDHSIGRYALTTAWDLSTIAALNYIQINTLSNMQGLFMGTDGLHMYLVASDDDCIYETNIYTTYTVLGQNSGESQGDVLVMTGGFDVQKGNTVTYPGSAGGTMNNTQIFDINKANWSKGADMPDHRYDHATCVHNNELYVFGGYSNSGPTKTSWKYNINNNVWTTGLADCPSEVIGAAAASDGRYIYLHGGTTFATSTFPGTAIRFDSGLSPYLNYDQSGYVLQSYTNPSNSPYVLGFRQLSHGSSAFFEFVGTWPSGGSVSFYYQMDNSLYSTMGFYIDGSFTYSDDAAFEPVNTWHQVTYNLTPGTHTLRWLLSRGQDGGDALFPTVRITEILLPGVDTYHIKTYSNQLIRYDTVRDAWDTLASSPIAQSCTRGGYYNGKLYFPGGITSDNSITSLMTIYNIGNDTWSTFNIGGHNMYDKAICVDQIFGFLVSEDDNYYGGVNINLKPTTPVLTTETPRVIWSLSECDGDIDSKGVFWIIPGYPVGLAYSSFGNPGAPVCSPGTPFHLQLQATKDWVMGAIDI